jgi:hypothetical protein
MLQENRAQINLKNAVSHELTRIFTNKPNGYCKEEIHLIGLTTIFYKPLNRFVFIRVNSWKKPVLG